MKDISFSTDNPELLKCENKFPFITGLVTVCITLTNEMLQVTFSLPASS